MTKEGQFWAELAEHRGEFAVDAFDCIRTKEDSPRCPVERVAEVQLGDSVMGAQRLGSVSHNHGEISASGWAAVIMDAADAPLHDLRSNRGRAVRRRLCEVLGLEES